MCRTFRLASNIHDLSVEEIVPFLKKSARIYTFFAILGIIVMLSDPPNTDYWWAMTSFNIVATFSVAFGLHWVSNNTTLTSARYCVLAVVLNLIYQIVVLSSAVHQGFLSSIIGGVIGVLISSTSLYVLSVFAKKVEARGEANGEMEADVEKADVESGYKISSSHQGVMNPSHQGQDAMSRPLI